MTSLRSFPADRSPGFFSMPSCPLSSHKDFTSMPRGASPTEHAINESETSTMKGVYGAAKSVLESLKQVESLSSVNTPLHPYERVQTFDGSSVSSNTNLPSEQQFLDDPSLLS